LERLRSLFDLPYMATASDLERLGLKLRSLRAGMHPSGNDRRRCLLREGQALLIYVLKTKASGALLRRYVRAVEKLRDGRDLGLPQLFLQWPVMLAIVDNGSNSKTVWGNELLWRLDSATILAEATPQGAQRFLGLGDRHGFTRSLLRMARAMLLELGWRLIGLLLLPVIRMQLRAKNGRTR
jgi:NADH dehydrogenase